MAKNLKITAIVTILAAIVGLYIKSNLLSTTAQSNAEYLSTIEKRSFPIKVHCVGELEACSSQAISSAIRGDLGKLIYLLDDGSFVSKGDVLAKLDPTPFEEKIEELKNKIQEQQAFILSLEKQWEWEANQAEAENKTALFEIEAAEMELNKVLYGDGPLELSRLNVALQKARSQYYELLSYFEELKALEEEGFVNHAELKQTQKKVEEAKENFEAALMQFDSYSSHVFPMQKKKAEILLKRSKIHQEESLKSGQYKIEKAAALKEQAKQALSGLNLQLENSVQELGLTELRAPSAGMVVLREEYRNGQKRRPRVGDILVRYQPLIDLPDLETMLIKTKVREQELSKVYIGAPVLIEIDACPSELFKGKVSSIGVLALADFSRVGEEKYFEIKIALDHCSGKLRPGMTARATVLSAEVIDKLTAPTQAIFLIDNKPHCYVKKGVDFAATEVKLGAGNDQFVEIKEGLNPLEIVYLINPSLME